MTDNDFNNEASNIQLRSDEINEILGVPPKWIVRWGISILFIILVTAFIGSAFFKYPDIIIAPTLISSKNPPSVIISKATGKITDIFFHDGSNVNKGDTIAIIENPARLADIKVLSKLIQRFNPKDKLSDLMDYFDNYRTLKLGEIQSQYNLFVKSYFDYQIFLKQNYREQKIKALESENEQDSLYYARLLSQKNLTIKDIDLTKKQFARDSQLYISNVIPISEYEKSQAVLLSKHQLLESAHLNLTNTSLNIARLKQSIIDLKFEQESQNNTLKEDLVSNYNQLISSLAGWEKSYLLIATSSGKLTYMNVWSTLQEVKSGDRLFTINPEVRGDVFAVLTIPFDGAGKIKPGENVNIKLDGYPYMEFGIVEGFIQSISNGSNEKGFPAIVQLNNGATTTYGYKLNIERDLSGIAEITTEDISLLKRLLNPLKYVFKNKMVKQKKEYK